MLSFECLIAIGFLLFLPMYVNNSSAETCDQLVHKFNEKKEEKPTCHDYDELMKCDKTDQYVNLALKYAAKHKQEQCPDTTTTRATTTIKPTTTVHHTSTNPSNTTDAAMNLFASHGRLVHFCGFVLCAHAIAMHHRH